MIDYIAEGQMSLFDQDTWFGKMSQELSVPVPRRERTSESSSKKLQGWLPKMPLFLDLRTANGHTQDASWERLTDNLGVLPGEPTTVNTGESPNVDVESRLSQILEEHPLPKYCLSAKACQGILSRAERRGKTLPKMLREALELQSASKNEQENPEEEKES